MILLRFSSLDKSKRTHDWNNDIVNAIFKMRIDIYDVSIKNLIWRDNDIFAFDSTIRLNVLKLKKLMNFIGRLLHDTHDEPDEQELEAHYMYMEKIQEVLTIDSGPTYVADPLEKVKFDDDYNVFATDKHHSKKPEFINDTCVVESIDSNVIPGSSDMCDNEGRLLHDTHDEPDEQELEAHYMYMEKIQEVPTIDSGPTYVADLLEKVKFDDDYNVFATDKHHFKKLEFINDTCVVESIDSNVIPGSSDIS
uniref:Uncharacterized protein n=1 Tax=Tanacetum cinerariifolium TaxID=118510 RepID=A0A6L2MRW2_TANCI|nr:hypothetical protein [Tanacetum cinerariifolium]